MLEKVNLAPDSYMNNNFEFFIIYEYNYKID